MTVLAKIARAKRDYESRWGSRAAYLVLDGPSLLAALHEVGVDGQGRDGQAEIDGMTVVVIPTDGIEFIRVVGWPMDEAQR